MHAVTMSTAKIEAAIRAKGLKASEFKITPFNGQCSEAPKHRLYISESKDVYCENCGFVVAEKKER